MARIKPCGKDSPEKMEQFLLGIHFDTMEIPLRESCAIFIQKSGKNTT